MMIQSEHKCVRTACVVCFNIMRNAHLPHMLPATSPNKNVQRACLRVDVKVGVARW